MAGRAWPVELGKWPTLLWLALATLLAMATWFSASAVVPALTAAWDLDEAGRAWLTMSVQAGFVVGALGSALLNLADRVPTRRLFTLSALLAAVATALVPLASSLALACRCASSRVWRWSGSTRSACGSWPPGHARIAA